MRRQRPSRVSILVKGHELAEFAFLIESPAIFHSYWIGRLAGAPEGIAG